MLPKDKKKKQDAENLVKKDKDPVTKTSGKAKQNWSQGIVWDKLNNVVPFDKATCDKRCK